MNNKRHIHIISQENASIGEVTKDIVDGLKNDFVITEEFLGEIPKTKEILLCHYISPAIVEHECFKDFRYKVLIFPIDGTKLIQKYIDCLNQFDLIITPAHAGLRILKNNGVTTHIKVIPNFWKREHLEAPLKIKQKSLDKEIKDKFVFYYEANLYPRKGYEELLYNFTKEFSSNSFESEAVLLIKTDNSLKTYEYFEKLKEKIIEIQNQYVFPAKIVKISQNLKFDDLKKIWHKIDCYVHPARIEGFGIPLLRMSVLNKPIIVLDNINSGYNDYLNFYPCCFKIFSHNVIALNEVNKVYSESSQWKIAEEASFRETLRLVYQKYKAKEYNCEEKIQFFNFHYYIKDYLYENIMKEYKKTFESFESKNLFVESKFISNE